MPSERFRKKPVEIEAVRFTRETASEAVDFCGGLYEEHSGSVGLMIRTLEGAMMASEGDWIIKGVQGEFYPCKPDIFEATYDAVG